MLVITRKIQESLQIGDDVVVHVLAVRGKTAKLGITAPETTGILRSEKADAYQPTKVLLQSPPYRRR